MSSVPCDVTCYCLCDTGGVESMLGLSLLVFTVAYE